MTNEELALAIKAGQLEKEPELWKNVERLIGMFAEKYYRNGCEERADIDLDDLKQAGFFALRDAVEHYDPDSGYMFSTYLHTFCRNRFNELAGVRSESQRNNPIRRQLRFAESLDAPAWINRDGESISLLDTIADPTDRIGAAEEDQFTRQMHGLIESALQKIPEDCAQVIRREYWMDQASKDMAEELGCSAEEIRLIKQRAVRWLRKNKELRKLYQELNPYRSVSLSSFRHSGFSSVELMVSRIEDNIRRMQEELAGPIE